MKEKTLKFLHKYLNWASNLNRKYKILVQIITDILASFGCLSLALLLHGQSLHFFADPKIIVGMIICILSGIIAFASFGLYKSLVRFITGKILIIITSGVLIGASTLIIFFIIAKINIPFIIPFIYGLLLFLSIGGIRFIIKQIYQKSYQEVRKLAIIYGAGEAGRELHNLLFYNQKIKPVAFIDDNESIQGLVIGGSKVYSRKSFIEASEKLGIKLVLLALPTVNQKDRKEIIEIFEKYDLEIKSIPPLSRILTGQALISELQSVTPELLLGRDAISPIKDLMQRNILNRSVMVTGAGGSIGSELCRQILDQKPSKLIVFELSELALYQINEELLQLKKQINSTTIIVSVLGSVQDEKCVTNTIATFGVTSIYHAAAYKHVPLVEDNVIEAIKNNVFGTYTLAKGAIKFNVEHFTLISSDKAVRPANIMGASKRIAELICQAQVEKMPKTKFALVRFGNVLGSSGSVIPLFQKQIDAGGPVTITHPEIIRYFMTIPEAAQLVIQASSMAKGGEVFVLDMGKPVKIVDLAIEMIKLSGLQPFFQKQTHEVDKRAGHIPICITGLRNGEKLYEELLIGNNPKPTEHPRIMKANEVSLPIDDLTNQLNLLRDACNNYDLMNIFEILKVLPLEFNHNKIQ